MSAPPDKRRLLDMGRTDPIEPTAKHRSPSPEQLDQVLNGLLRIMAKVAEGDFTEKPAIDENDGPLGHFLVAFRFLIEDLERAHKARQDELTRLRELDEMKTRFINLAAHELNTPLTPIRIHLHLLTKRDNDNLTPKQAGAVQALDRNLDRLGRSVGDLLDVARMQSQRFRVHLVPTDLAHLIRSAADDFRGTAAEHGLRFEVNAPDELWMAVDDDRVAQVVHNLLTNAGKFTSPGGRVGLHLVDAGNHALISVSDDGVGLARHQLALLFRPFVQIHPDHEQATEGTGLGLFITKGIVEAHDGRIWCDSDGPGKGSRFTVLLPKRPANAHEEDDPAEDDPAMS